MFFLQMLSVARKNCIDLFDLSIKAYLEDLNADDRKRIEEIRKETTDLELNLKSGDRKVAVIQKILETTKEYLAELSEKGGE